MAKQIGAAKGPGGGYDYEFVDAPPKSLECSICLLTLRDPHVISCCGNHFCYSCISCISDNKKPCPLCQEPEFTTFLHKGVAREVNALKVYCPNKPEGCDWQGELGQVENHLNPKDVERGKGCGFVMVECKYKCGRRFQWKAITSHETEECLNRPLEVQMAHLTKKFESLAAENRAEIVAIKQESKAEMESVKQEFEAKILTLQAENAFLKKQLHIHSPPTPVPPFIFTVDNYTLIMQNNSMFCSPPFYSHPGGYKMECRVCPNDLQTGIGYKTHISVFILILKGEYDEELDWPFKGRIIVEIYNWQEKKYGNRKEIQIENAECARIPEKSRRVNISYRLHKFCEISTVKQCLTKWDTLGFKIDVEI